MTVDEYKEIIGAFPRLGFKEQFVEIMCGLCALKPDTTYGKFVGDYGVEYGIDGKGAGKEDFARERHARSSTQIIPAVLARCEEYEDA